MAVAAGKRMAIPPNCPFGPLIESCWAQDPKSRPEFEEIFLQLHKMKDVHSTPFELQKQIIKGFKEQVNFSLFFFKNFFYHFSFHIFPPVYFRPLICNFFP
jgi:hypothetical protein